jgi:hypothetical protein
MSRPFVIALLAAVVSAPALAADKPRVLVVPFVAGNGVPETAAGRFSGAVSDELKSRADSLELLATPALRPAPADKPAAGARRGPDPEALAALDAGRKAFDDLRFEDAMGALRRGITGVLADPASADYPAVVDAYVKLAAAAFRQGEEKEAKTALLELARMSPGYELPPGFPPVFQLEFAKAKKRLDKQPRGQVSVEGPPGATAFLDGRDLGLTPVLEENVPAGVHYVKVEGSKGERFGQAIEVAGALVKVRAAFAAGGGERAVVSGPVDPKISQTLDEATAQRLASLVKATGADYALVGFISSTGDTSLTAVTALYSGKQSAFTVLEPAPFDTEFLAVGTAAFKLVDQVLPRLDRFGASAALPISLMARKGAVAVAPARTPVVAVNKPVDVEDVQAVTPEAKKPVLTPVERPLAQPSTVVEIDGTEHLGEKPPEVKRSGVPAWVWVVAGVAVAAGAGVGGYFAYSAATKPVTGTVTASW